MRTYERVMKSELSQMTPFESLILVDDLRGGCFNITIDCMGRIWKNFKFKWWTSNSFLSTLRYAARPPRGRVPFPLSLDNSVDKFEKCVFEWMNAGKTMTFPRIKKSIYIKNVYKNKVFYENKI